MAPLSIQLQGWPNSRRPLNGHTLLFIIYCVIQEAVVSECLWVRPATGRRWCGTHVLSVYQTRRIFIYKLLERKL